MISREQVVGKLRAIGFKHCDQTKRVELYRKPGTPKYISVARRDEFTEKLVRIVLSQAGMTPEEIDRFIEGAAK